MPSPNITVVLPGQAPIAVTLPPAIEVTIGSPDETLQLHSLLQGLGGHIPLTGVPTAWITGLGDAATADRSEFATALQGELATSALQPGEVTVGDVQGLVEFIESVQNNTDRLVFTLSDIEGEYYYYGGSRSNGQWQINRLTKGSLITTVAARAANAAYTSLSEAWEMRSSLIFEGS